MKKNQKTKFAVTPFMEKLMTLPLVETEYHSFIMAELEKGCKKFPQGFVKHCRPCSDQSNFDGLCWLDLGISRYYLENAFRNVTGKRKIRNVIGVHYQSKEEYLLAKEARTEFQDRYYCSFTDSDKRTYYYRNNALVEPLLEALLCQEYQLIQK